MNSRLMLIGGGGLILLLLVGAFLLLSNNSDTTEPTNNPITEQPLNEEQSTSATPAAEATSVSLTSTGFSPKDITIKKGAKVIWTNNSGAPATIDSTPHPIHTSYPELNLGNFMNGETLEFVFPEAGKFNYHNHLNSSQGGSVTVEE